MVPALSLSYSSQSGDGIVGLGWGLNGLSTITHCPRTLAQDGVHGGVNYDANDRFCLDGQRLILSSGTYGADGSTYYTEIDQFARVIAHGSAGNGPSWFEVQKPSGLNLQLGNTADSKILAIGKTTVRAWSLNKIADKKSNYLSVAYTNDTTYGQFYPARIDYTGNSAAGLSPHNSVQFTYVTRPHSAPSYQAGSLVQTTVLLTHIKTFAGSTPVLDYEMAYGLATSGASHDELETVSLCDASGVCLAPTNFGWQGSRDVLTVTTVSNGLAQGAGLLGGDLNGDGLTDAVVPTANCSGSMIYTGSQTGSFAQSSMTIQYDWMNPNTGGDPAVQTYNGPACLPVGGTFAGDIDGDGLDDLVITVPWYKYADISQKWHEVDTRAVLKNSGAGQLVQVNTDDSLNAVNFFPPPAFPSDFNGDGRSDGFSDSFTYDSNGDGSFIQDAGRTGFDTSVVSTTGDFDGDGCTDLIAPNGGNAIAYYCNPAVSQVTIPTFPNAKLAFGDFNGDGKTDVLAETSSGATLYLATGTGLNSGIAIPSSAGWYGYASTLTGDWNGDGKADIALISQTSGQAHLVLLSTGTGFAQAASIPNSDTNTTASVADWNNDGAADLWIQRASGDAEYLFSYVPELITSVSNGLGAASTITYDRLNHGTVYTKGSGAAYPTQDIIGSLYAVSELSAANGNGGTYNRTFHYAGLKKDVYGRGGLGFTQMTMTDAQTGVVQTTNFRTDFPYAGLISSQTTQSGSIALQSVSNTYAATNEGSALPGSAYYSVSLQQNALSRRDLGGTIMPSVTTNYTYDAYNNPLTESVLSSDGSSKTTTNTYLNDTSNWLLGRLTSASTTSTVTDSVQNGTTDGNYPPTAVNDSASTNQNTAVTLDPRSNDGDPDGDTVTVTGVGTPSHGTATFTGSSVTYTPTTGYSGSDSFSYTITDGHSHSATATISVTIKNQPPTAVADSLSTYQNTAKSFDPRTNDTDPNNDTLTITAVGAASHGSATFTGTSVTYTPTSGYSGSDAFTYTISDGHGNSASATVSVTITNRPPVAVNDNVSTNENTLLIFDPRGNDSDPDGDPITVLGAYNGGGGQVGLDNGGPSVRFNPTPGYSGPAYFYYTISDGHGHTATATVNVTVVNRPPVAVNDSITVSENHALAFTPYSNDSDPDNDPLSVTLATSPSHGTATISNNIVTYTPAANYYGSDSFLYTLSDGHGHTATGTVFITVVQGPAAVADSAQFTVNLNANQNCGTPSGNISVLANDVSPQGYTLTVSSVTNGSKGTVANHGSYVTYTYGACVAVLRPTTDTFTYTLSDGHGGSSTGAVTVSLQVTYSGGGGGLN